MGGRLLPPAGLLRWEGAGTDEGVATRSSVAGRWLAGRGAARVQRASTRRRAVQCRRPRRLHRGHRPARRHRASAPPLPGGGVRRRRRDRRRADRPRRANRQPGAGLRPPADQRRRGHLGPAVHPGRVPAPAGLDRRARGLPARLGRRHRPLVSGPRTPSGRCPVRGGRGSRRRDADRVGARRFGGLPLPAGLLRLAGGTCRPGRGRARRAGPDRGRRRARPRAARQARPRG